MLSAMQSRAALCEIPAISKAIEAHGFRPQSTCS